MSLTLRWMRIGPSRLRTSRRVALACITTMLLGPAAVWAACSGIAPNCHAGCGQPFCTVDGVWDCLYYDAGTPCDDGKACTVNDVCDGAGTCHGTPNTGAACNDGNACTYNDTCNSAGQCVGTPITCTSTTCQSQTCNGTSACTVTNAATGTACNTGDVCTYNDQCNGSGSCVGAPVTITLPSGRVEPCRSTTCQSRQCNKTATCVVLSTASAGSACDDGNACTYNDTCDGTGGCGGKPITCAGTACSTQTCNGTASCTVALKPSTTQCQAATTGYSASNCDGASAYCPIRCAAGYKLCGAACIPSGSCCTNADCPVAGGFQTCTSGTCAAPVVCAAGYKACSSACIAETACCSSTDCPAVPNATGTCTSNGCAYSCLAGYQQCGNSCISTSACCG